MKKVFISSILFLLCFTCFIFVGCDNNKEKYNINFIVENEIHATIETYGNEIIVLPENPSKDLYDFKGWYWDENYELPFNENSIKDVSLSKDLNIYAKFEISANALWQKVGEFQNVYAVNANNELNSLSATQTSNDYEEMVKVYWFCNESVNSIKLEFYHENELVEYRIYYTYDDTCYAYYYYVEDDTYDKTIEDENYSESTCEFQTYAILSSFSSSMYDSTDIINFNINDDNTFTFYLTIKVDDDILSCEVIVNETGLVLKEIYTRTSTIDSEDIGGFILTYDYNYDTEELQEQVNQLIEEYETAKELCLSGQHDWYITQSTNATCTEDGIEYYSCYNCTATKEELIIATGHDWYISETINATCNQDGTEHYSCYNCSATNKELIDALHKNLLINSSCLSCGRQCVDNTQNTILLNGDEGEGYRVEYYGTIATNIYSSYDLNSVYISKNVKTIAPHTFNGQRLYEVEFEENSTLESLGAYSFNNSSLHNIDLSNCTSLTSIGSHAFANNPLEVVDLRFYINLTSIEYRAFYNCIEIKSVYLPSNLITIESYAFDNCFQLAYINLSDCTNLTTIGSNAFENCISLSITDLPNSLKSVGSNAFTRCKLGTSLIKNGIKYIGSATNQYLIAYATESNELVNVTLDNNCKVIADGAFSTCTNLEYIIIPSEIKGIGTLNSNITKYYLGSSMMWENLVFCCDTENCSHKDNTSFYLYPRDDGKKYWRYDSDGITPIPFKTSETI